MGWGRGGSAFLSSFSSKKSGIRTTDSTFRSFKGELQSTFPLVALSNDIVADTYSCLLAVFSPRMSTPTLRDPFFDDPSPTGYTSMLNL